MAASKFEFDRSYYEDIWLNTFRYPIEAVDACKAFQFDRRDILCPSYPKAGQTWLLTILHLMTHSEYLETDDMPPITRDTWNFLETKRPDGKLQAEETAKKPAPRIIKTHLPLKVFKPSLDQNPELKIIQVVRNPMDTLVSYYNFYCKNEMLGCFTGSWNEFFELVKNKELCWGDLFTQTADWYQYNKNRDHSLVLVYEEMKKDLKANVVKIANFIGMNLSDSIIDLIVQKSSFDSMSKDPKLNMASVPTFLKGSNQSFMRKGMVGDHSNYFDEVQTKYVEQRCKECLEPLGLTFTYK